MLNIYDYDVDLLNLVDIEETLHLLLSQIRILTSSDAGTIYLKEGNNLKIYAFQNNSLSLNKVEQIFEDSKFIKLSFDNRQHIAVKSFISLNIMKIDNLYEELELDVSGIKVFDSLFNYKTHSMVTIPLVNSNNKNPMGILQLINKTKDGICISYSNHDVELMKIASNFISYTISKTIEYKNSLKKIDGIINSVINYEVYNRIEEDRLNSFQNKIIHTSNILKDIAQQTIQPLCELSLNNAYLSSKLEDVESTKLLNENQFVIQSLSSMIKDFEVAYEEQEDLSFNIKAAFRISYKLINTYITTYNIKIIQNIDKNIMIYGRKDIFIQVILSIIWNSFEAFKAKKINEPYIKINIFNINEEIVIIFEDNAGGIYENLLLNIFELNENKQIKSNNMTLNILKIIIRDKFKGKIFANNTKNGLMIKIVINTDNTLSGVNNG